MPEKRDRARVVVGAGRALSWPRRVLRGFLSRYTSGAGRTCSGPGPSSTRAARVSRAALQSGHEYPGLPVRGQGWEAPTDAASVPMQSESISDGSLRDGPGQPLRSWAVRQQPVSRDAVLGSAVPEHWRHSARRELAVLRHELAQLRQPLRERVVAPLPLPPRHNVHTIQPPHSRGRPKSRPQTATGNCELEDESLT